MRVLRIAALLAVACAGFLLVPESRAAAEVLVIIDKASQRMSVAIDGRTRYVWPVSTGRRGYGTPSGQFRPQWMARTYFSRKYYNSPMPHSIFFYRGYAIHGTEYIHRLGGPASHGCVRLHPHNAATLFALVQRHGMHNTRIVIGDSIALQRPERWGARDRNELTIITRMADRLMLAEQIERQEALARMAQMRASEALRRMQARNAGKPFVPDPDALVVAIGVQTNKVPYEPENVVLEAPDPGTAAEAEPPAPMPRKRAAPQPSPARRLIRHPTGRPAATKAAPATPPARVERRRDKVTLRLAR